MYPIETEFDSASSVVTIRVVELLPSEAENGLPTNLSSQYSSDSLIQDELIKLNSIPDYFTNKIDILLIDSTNYKFTLSPNKEILISPSTIGMPFKLVSYQLGGLTYQVIGESTFLYDNMEI